MNKLYVRISKFLAYVLRHHPEKFDIELDVDGYANLQIIINLLDKKFPEHHINEVTIKDIMKTSDKRRYEIVDDKIRAFYGHSVKDKIKMRKVESLPQKLYHGTNLSAFQKIKTQGLKRKSRQYVHLSESLENAYLVGRRKTHNPVILVIDSNQAAKNGVNFYRSGDMYLADYIPPEYISLHSDNP